MLPNTRKGTSVHGSSHFHSLPFLKHVLTLKSSKYSKEYVSLQWNWIVTIVVNH